MYFWKVQEQVVTVAVLQLLNRESNGSCLVGANAFMYINQLSYFMDVDVFTQHYSHISISEPKPFSTYFKDNKNIRFQTILIGFHKSHGLTVSTNNTFLPLKKHIEFFIQNLILPDLPTLCSVFIKT